MAIHENDSSPEARVSIITVGNHSYIPFDCSMPMGLYHTKRILHLLQDFEQENPSVEVLSWQSDWYPHMLDGGGVAVRVAGILVTHRPKK